jgi:hypothetical protein
VIILSTDENYRTIDVGTTVTFVNEYYIYANILHIHTYEYIQPIWIIREEDFEKLMLLKKKYRLLDEILEVFYCIFSLISEKKLNKINKNLFLNNNC